MSRTGRRVRGRVRHVRRRWRSFAAPTAHGLPNRRVMGWGLGILAAAYLLLVATSLNGTSSGAFFAQMYAGTDPSLLLGTPNVIRVDEWKVQTVWALTQVQQGLPALNGSFVGGMDATLPQDLPRLDWSMVFRPHLWGFALMDVDHAQAWKWWMPVFGVAATGFAFFAALIPRRPIAAMGLAVGFAASPFFAWWLLQTTLWPVAWGFAVLSAVIWAARTGRRASLWVWGFVVAFLTIVVGMGIYVPFIIPIVVIVLLTAIGLGVEAAPVRGWQTILRRLGTVVAAGVVGGAVLAVWILTRWGTVTAFLVTAYPGERLEPTGTAGQIEGFVALFASSFTDILTNTGLFINGNASESATFFVPGIFLGVVVLWLTIRERRARRRLPWAVILAYSGLLVLLAFIFLPGWDGLAHLLFLDRTTSGRARIGVGFGSMVVVALLLARIRSHRRPGWVVSSTGPAVFLASQAAFAAALAMMSPRLLAEAELWWLYVAIGTLVILGVARGWTSLVAAGMLVISVAGTWGVNPLYAGVFDLRSTEIGLAIAELDAAVPGAWVGVGSDLTTALLLESGATGYNGFQGAPIEQMWAQIDPSGEYEYEWNRLAGVSWVAGVGDPEVSNPYPDQIQVTFDACADFAQEHVRYVLADDAAHVDTTCLTRREHFHLATADLTIWEVTPPR